MVQWSSSTSWYSVTDHCQPSYPFMSASKRKSVTPSSWASLVTNSPTSSGSCAVSIASALAKAMGSNSLVAISVLYIEVIGHGTQQCGQLSAIRRRRVAVASQTIAGGVEELDEILHNGGHVIRFRPGGFHQ